MRPKKEVPRTEQTVPIKISAPKAKVLERPQNRKLPKVLERPEVQKKEKRTKTPGPVRGRNDRNVANPRPGSVQQTIERLPTAQYVEVKDKRRNSRLISSPKEQENKNTTKSKNS